MHGSWISLKLRREASWGNRRTLWMMIHGGGARRLSRTVEIEVEKTRAAITQGLAKIEKYFASSPPAKNRSSPVPITARKHQNGSMRESPTRKK